MAERDRGPDDVAASLIEGEVIDWTRLRRDLSDSQPLLDGLELLEKVGRSFRAAAGEEAAEDAAPALFRWGSLLVLEKLGEGSYGEVFRARDPLLDRDVALKLRRHGTDSLRNRAYIDEARRLARVRHPNVVVVHGIDVHDRRIGLWTELIDGETLEDGLDREGPVSPSEALAVGLDLCRALAAVHAAELVHGDVKASNVMREVGGRIVLMDFGAGRSHAGGSDSSGTFGTPLVTAPEVLTGDDPTPRADLYSLGVLLFLLLTGEYLADAEDMTELLRMHQRGELRELRTLRPDLAPASLRGIDKALRPDPLHRYHSAPEMERDLASALNQELARSGAAAGVAARSRPDSGPLEPDFQPFIGRLGELASLESGLREAKSGSPRPILVRGPAGVGKTALTQRFLETAAEEGTRTLYARFLDYRGSRLAPFETLLRLLRSALGVDSVADLAAAAERDLGVRLPSELLAAPAAEAASALTGRGEAGPGDRFRGAVPVAECFRALAGERPLVLALDDLQWADAAALDVLGYLLRSLEGEPLFLLMVARQDAEKESEIGDWLRRHAGYRTYTSVSLHPFGEHEIEATLEVIFPGLVVEREVPPQDLAELARVTGGNPYYLNEICRLLVAHRRVVVDPEASSGWAWKGWSDLELPESLLLAAGEKLNLLSGGERSVVDRAAVIGDEFRVETLAAMTRRVDAAGAASTEPVNAEDLSAALAKAVDVGVVSPATSEEEDYQFDHPLLRDVVYDGLAPDRRRDLHRYAALAIEEVYSAEIDGLSSVLSAHWAAAREPQAAFTWSLQAWAEARRRWQWPEALECLERAEAAAEALGADDRPSTEQAFRLALGLAEAYASVGRIRDSEARLASCVDLADRLDDAEARGVTCLQQSRTWAARGRYQQAAERAEEAVELLSSAGDVDGSASAKLQLATICAATGDYQRVHGLTTEILDLVPEDSDIAAIAAGVAGWSLALQGHYDRGSELLERARRHHRRTGNLRQHALILNRLQWVDRARGEYQAAVETAREARALFRRVEDANFEAKANMALGQCRLEQGLVDEGRAYLEKTLRDLAEIGDAHCEAEVRWLLGRALGELGEHEQALESLDRALAMIAEIGDRDDEFRFLIDRARVLTRAGRPDDALEAAATAESIAAELDNEEGVASARAEAARARLQQGDAASARDLARDVVETLEGLGSGELWRALHTLGSAYEATAGDADGVGDPEPAASVLRRAVAITAAIRAQIPATDFHRRQLAAEGLAAPARDLHRLLVETGEAAEAERLAADWLVG